MRSATEIETWLLERLQARLDDRSQAALPAGEQWPTQFAAEIVDSHMPFSYFGLTSIDAVVLAAELQDWLGVPVSPTLTWEYPTVSAVAGYLAGEPSTSPTGAIDYKLLLAELEAPSER